MAFDFYKAFFSGSPVKKATPGPVFGSFGQAASDGIAMDVAELFDEFLLGEDIEVVVAALPKLRPFAFQPFRRLCLQSAKDVVEL